MGIVISVLLFVVLVIVGIAIAIVDAIRWVPWARRHGYRKGAHVDVTDWGRPFGTESPLTYAAFHGSLGDKPMHVLRYRSKLDGADTRHDMQLCAVDLGRPVGRLHLRQRDAGGPLAAYPETGARPLGDPFFDGRYEVAGEPALAAAVLTPDVRQFLLGVDVAGVRLVGQWLVVIGRATTERRAHHDHLIAVAGGLLARLPRTVNQRANWAA